jgi:hypothetical protein
VKASAAVAAILALYAFGQPFWRALMKNAFKPR